MPNRLTAAGPTAEQTRLRRFVIWPSLIGLLMLAALGIISAQVQSAARAYVGAESLWSKGQKSAVAHLVAYASSRNVDDYILFAQAIAVPLGDRKARHALEQSTPDLALARRGFIEGGNHPEDIDEMVWLFRNFRHVPFMADAIDVWAEADAQLAELNAVAQEIRERVQAGEANSPQMRELLAALSKLDGRLTILEQQFSATMGEASRLIQRLVQAATLLLALTLAGTAVLFSTRQLHRQARDERALRVSQERLQRALEASHLCLWDFDATSGEVYLSEEWSLLLGGPSQVTRTTIGALVDRLPAGERDGARAAFTHALSHPQAGYRYEHRVLRQDGTAIWVLSEGRVVARSAEGRALRMVGTNRDISEHKAEEATRLALETHLRNSQKMEAIGTLAGGIAHDFNNILGALLGQVALVRDDIRAGRVALPGLDQIDKSARRARRLVKQILAFSRREPQQLLNLQLRPALDETLALLRATLPAGVQLEARLADVPLHVVADATQLQQVMMNLCTNAWHALQGRMGRIELGLTAAVLAPGDAQRPGGLPPGHYAHIWVEDTGCGMDDATLTRIFEPFYTTKAVDQGTGLGLSVVHGIVAAHRGAISVSSSLGVGSRFDLYFPLVPAQDAAASDWGGLAPQIGGAGQHVLVVDDDEVMYQVVTQLLQRQGYRVSGHHDPRQAVATVRENPHAIDLVLSDYNMPGFSGLDVVRELASIRADLPVVISSGNLSERERSELMRAGVHAILQKENTVDELGPLLVRLLEAAARQARSGAAVRRTRSN